MIELSHVTRNFKNLDAVRALLAAGCAFYIRPMIRRDLTLNS